MTLVTTQFIRNVAPNLASWDNTNRPSKVEVWMYDELGSVSAGTIWVKTSEVSGASVSSTGSFSAELDDSKVVTAFDNIALVALVFVGMTTRYVQAQTFWYLDGNPVEYQLADRPTGPSQARVRLQDADGSILTQPSLRVRVSHAADVRAVEPGTTSLPQDWSVEGVTGADGICLIDFPRPFKNFYISVSLLAADGASVKEIGGPANVFASPGYSAPFNADISVITRQGDNAIVFELDPKPTPDRPQDWYTYVYANGYVQAHSYDDVVHDKFSGRVTVRNLGAGPYFIEIGAEDARGYADGLWPVLHQSDPDYFNDASPRTSKFALKPGENDLGVFHWFPGTDPTPSFVTSSRAPAKRLRKAGLSVRQADATLELLGSPNAPGAFRAGLRAGLTQRQVRTLLRLGEPWAQISASGLLTWGNLPPAGELDIHLVGPELCLVYRPDYSALPPSGSVSLAGLPLQAQPPTVRDGYSVHRQPLAMQDYGSAPAIGSFGWWSLDFSVDSAAQQRRLGPDRSMSVLLRGGFTRNQAKLILGSL